MVASSTTASASSSRRPSVRISLEHLLEESRTTGAPQQQQQQQHHHHHRRHHSGHRHRSSGGGGGGSSGGSHQNITSIAALAAAATVAAAGSPMPLQIPTTAVPQRPSDGGGGGSVGGSSGSSSVEAARAPLPGTIVPPPGTDPVLLAGLRRLQHDQDRAAARLLQATLADLNSLSASTGQRLDATYGSVLSRLGILQGTVQALRSLAITARATNSRFRVEARSLADEVEQQVARFEGSGGAGDGRDVAVDTAGAATDSAATATAIATATATTALSAPLPSDQQHRLEQLHARVLAGRESIQTLGGRVEAVRERVERWERADLAWQERTRTRLKVLWAIVSGVVLALVVLLVVTARSNKAGRAAKGDGNSSLSAELLPPALGNGVVELGENTYSYSDLASTTHKHELRLSFHNSSDADGHGGAAVTEGDPLVQMFDEL